MIIPIIGIRCVLFMQVLASIWYQADVVFAGQFHDLLHIIVTAWKKMKWPLYNPLNLFKPLSYDN